MGRSRRFGFGLGLAVAVLSATVSAGCGGSSHGEASHGAEGHGGESAPALPPPTPDTTPIEALRTPAGLVLKIGGPTTPAAIHATTTATTPAATTPTPSPK